jgi:hypothetical protein
MNCHSTRSGPVARQARRDDVGSRVSRSAAAPRLLSQLVLQRAPRRFPRARPRGPRLDSPPQRRRVATWSTWSELLAAHNVTTLPDGTYGAALARSILRKILVSPIVVTPEREPSAPIDFQKWCASGERPDVTWTTHWSFRGISRFDSVPGRPGEGRCHGRGVDVLVGAQRARLHGPGRVVQRPHPISGGSDAPIEGVSNGRGLDGPPKPPALGDGPAEPGRPSGRRDVIAATKWPPIPPTRGRVRIFAPEPHLPQASIPLCSAPSLAASRAGGACRPGTRRRRRGSAGR